MSADIETLQARSTALNVRLENRRAVEKALGPIVEELSVSPIVVSKISEGHIDEAWIKVLAEVDKRAAAQKKAAPQQPQSKAHADVGPLLEKLVLKVGWRHPTVDLERVGYNANPSLPGRRTNTGLPRRPDQGAKVAQYQRPDYPAAELSQVQGPLHLPPPAPARPCGRDLPGLPQHDALVLPESVHSLPKGAREA